MHQDAPKSSLDLLSPGNRRSEMVGKGHDPSSLSTATSGGFGAGGRVPAAKSEWLMLVQSGDLGGRVATARSAFCGPIALSPERGSTPKRLAKPCHLVLSTLLPAAAAGWPSAARWVENCLK